MSHDQAKKLANLALQLSIRSDYQYGQALARGSLALIYFHDGNNKGAIKEWLISLQQFDEKLLRRIYKEHRIPNLFDSLFNQVFKTDMDSAARIAEQMLLISKELNYKRGQADALSCLGLVETNKLNNKKAIDYYFSAIQICEQEQRLVSADTFSDTYGLLLVRLAGAYMEEADYKQALTLTGKAAVAAKRINDFALLGLAFRIRAEAFTELDQIDSSNYFFQKAVTAFTKIDDRTQLMAICLTSALNYYRAKDYRKALSLAKKSIALAKSTGDKVFSSYGYNNVGSYLHLLNSYDSAIAYLDTAQYLQKTYKLLVPLLDTYQTKAKAYQALGKTDSTAHYFEKVIALKDTIHNDAHKKEIAEVQSKIKVEETETENKLLEKDKDIAELYRNLFIAGFFLLTAILAFVLVSQKFRVQGKVKMQLEREVMLRTAEIAEQKEEINKANLQLKLSLNRSRFDSHFIFNILNSIQHLVLQKKPDQARDHLSKLSRLIRWVLEKSSIENVPLQSELEILEHYIQLEQLRLDNKFTYTLRSDASSALLVPAMLIQPFVENAILHGLGPAPAKDLSLQLEIHESGESLKITIEDNGVGRMHKSSNPERVSLGNSLVVERFQILEQLSHQTFHVETFDLKDNEQNKGTRVLLEIPISKEITEAK